MRQSHVFFSLVMALSGAAHLNGAGVPDFNRDIRPILSDKCFRCHGPDERERKGGQNGLRLDSAAGAREDLGGGAFAIVPGKPDKSELIARITSGDEEEIMPPAKTGKTLSKREIELLRSWIESGASYAQHWSYEPPRQVPLPEVRDAKWPKNAVDRFVLARLEKDKLTPQPEADRVSLARRVALDLTGLPPSVNEVDAFLRDQRPNAYEHYVDAQLAKPAYGEHWARGWLDLARYADSKGYADDQARSIWKYRDYVIDAFNQNMPFDQFTIEQLAGDLLSNPTQAQLFATGFHRNTMNNTEGGTDDEEFRSAAIVDRVNTTMAVWMGTSMACAQCHTHKYDPLTQKEYFQLYAIFNQSEDADRSDESPVLEFYTKAQQEQRRAWESEIATLSRKMLGAKSAHHAAAEKWAREFPLRIDWHFATPRTLTSAAKAAMHADQDGRVVVSPRRAKDTYTIEVPVADGVPITALRLQTLATSSASDAAADGAKSRFVITRVRAGVAGADPFRRARYVRVELPGKMRTLQLAEVEVFSSGQNLAARGISSQSSTIDGAEAKRATDGLTSGDYTRGSVTQTETSDNPWWELDLGAAEAIDRVVVWGRTGAEATPAGLHVTVLDENRRQVWEQTARAAPNPSRAFVLSDPVDLKLSNVVTDYNHPDYDESLIITDAEPRARAAKKKGTPRRGWSMEASSAATHTLSVQPDEPISLRPGEKLIVTIEQQAEAPEATLRHFRLGTTTDARVKEHLRTPLPVIGALAVAEKERTAQQRDQLLDYYVREIAPEWMKERKRVAALDQSLEDMPINSSPIMHELPVDKRRKTHLQHRGNFMALGDEVEPGVPAAFPPLTAGVTADRLALARWLVDDNNPLTARVLANRLWESIFGIGLVRTTEEFGSQGEPPTHPELLDWLAVDLVRSKWDMKRMIKMLVLTAAYRQGSKVTPEALATDPENRLLSRGPRFRLSAEMVRDQALAVSGLLSSKTHGPSVRPYQPAFDLKAAFGSALDWKPSPGEDRFRRGLYTEWRRSSPYPSMVTFDAPNREVCTLRRDRSNTPLQALVTLNDPVYVEAAQALGRLMAQAEGSFDDKLRGGFRRVLARPPNNAEAAQLKTLWENARAHYGEKPGDAESLIASPGNPEGGVPTKTDPVALAAWTTVANVLLNLDEALMKR